MQEQLDELFKRLFSNSKFMLAGTKVTLMMPLSKYATDNYITFDDRNLYQFCQNGQQTRTKGGEEEHE